MRSRNCPSEAYSLHHTQIIWTHHPGYSVNYHPNDPQKRQELLRSICKVYDALASNKSEKPRRLVFFMVPSPTN